MRSYPFLSFHPFVLKFYIKILPDRNVLSNEGDGVREEEVKVEGRVRIRKNPTLCRM